MRRPARVLTMAVLLGGLCAQQTFTSPVGYESTEAPSVTTVHPITTSMWTSRWQFVDGGQRGAGPRALTRLEMRRDGYLPSVHAPETTAQLGILMAHADACARVLSTTFAGNWASPPVAVLGPKTVALPNLSSFPAVPPAPWSVVLPFDVPFAFDGARDLLWEFVVLRQQMASDYRLDAVVAATPPGLGTVAAGAGGCATPNGTFALSGLAPQTGPGGGVSLAFLGRGAPGQAPAWLALGLTDPQFAWFCEKVCSSAEVAVPFMTNALGEIGAVASPATIAFLFPGEIPIQGQLVALDASQPLGGITFSNCVRWQVVAFRKLAGITLLDDRYYWAAETGSWHAGSVPVVRWSY